MRVKLTTLMVAVVASVGVWAQVQVAVPPSQARDSQPQVQATAPATALIMGTVMTGGTGQPADGVRVTLSGNDLRGSRSTLTDDSGNFAFMALPPGIYTLRATKTGYVSASYGQKQPGRPGTSIVLAVGQQLKGVTMEVPRAGVISGTIYDEKNRPAVGVSVRVMQWSWQSGERVLNPSTSASTDDRGIYRIFGLSPGEYLVNAVPRNTSSTTVTIEDMQSLARMEELTRLGLATSGDLSRVMISRDPAEPAASNEPVSGYAAMYYPGTPQPGNAQTVKVAVSQEQLGIDFQLQRVPLSKVTGTVMVPSGVNPTTVQLRLIETASLVPGLQQFSARPTAQGGFTFTALPPGQYQVIATATVPVARPAGATDMPAQMKAEMEMQNSSVSGRRLWAVADVTVDGGYAPNVVLTLQEGMTVSGSVSFDGTAAQAQMSRIRVTLASRGQAMSSLGLAQVAVTPDANGRFTFTGVSPGQYVVRATGAAGWSVRSVMADGRDTLDFGLDVKPGDNVTNVSLEFTDKFTDIKGTLQGPAGQPTSDYTVIIFSADSRHWVPLMRRVRSARPSSDGKFSFNGLPAGEYRIAAVTDVEPGAWYDPAFLQQLQGASIAVRLMEGQPAVQDVRVSGG